MPVSVFSRLHWTGLHDDKHGVISARNWTVSDAGNLKASNVVRNFFDDLLNLEIDVMIAISVGHPWESIREISFVSMPSTATKSRTKISYGPEQRDTINRKVMERKNKEWERWKAKVMDICLCVRDCNHCLLCPKQFWGNTAVKAAEKVVPPDEPFWSPLSPDRQSVDHTHYSDTCFIHRRLPCMRTPERSC